MHKFEERAWIDVKSLARSLDVSTRTVWRWRKAGLLPIPCVIAGTVRWDATVIRQWLSQHHPSVTHAKGSSR